MSVQVSEPDPTNDQSSPSTLPVTVPDTAHAPVAVIANSATGDADVDALVSTEADAVMTIFAEAETLADVLALATSWRTGVADAVAVAVTDALATGIFIAVAVALTEPTEATDAVI